eukprot:1557771-Pyramimonas_sp.AAC.1
MLPARHTLARHPRPLERKSLRRGRAKKKGKAPVAQRGAGSQPRRAVPCPTMSPRLESGPTPPRSG